MATAKPVQSMTLGAYADQRQLPHWLLAALRTACPIEQHMRHGKSLEDARQAEYLAHTSAHAKPVTEWDSLVITIKGGR